MTKLRQQLIEVLTLRRYAPKTHEAYVESVAGLAGFHHRSPDLLSDEEIKSYLLATCTPKATRPVRSMCG